MIHGKKSIREPDGTVTECFVVDNFSKRLTSPIRRRLAPLFKSAISIRHWPRSAELRRLARRSPCPSAFCPDGAVHEIDGALAGFNVLLQRVLDRDLGRVAEVSFAVRAVAKFAFDLCGLRLVRRAGRTEEFLALNLELVIPVFAVVSTY